MFYADEIEFFLNPQVLALKVDKVAYLNLLFPKCNPHLFNRSKIRQCLLFVSSGGQLKGTFRTQRNFDFSSYHCASAKNSQTFARVALFKATHNAMVKILVSTIGKKNMCPVLDFTRPILTHFKLSKMFRFVRKMFKADISTAQSCIERVN